MTEKRKYGWKPDLPDVRDLLFRAHFRIEELPPIVDLRSRCGPVVNQLSLGSCTANAIASAHLYAQKNEPNSEPRHEMFPSRLFIYYNERSFEGTEQFDSGAHLRDGIKSVVKLGVCDETIWPYAPAAFATKPTNHAYSEALNHLALEYRRILGFNDCLSCLASGYPFVFGFTVYESFESPQTAKTGIASLPSRHERFLGGHAVMCVGYDTPKQAFLVMNSWGTAWGLGGYFYLPFQYIYNSNLSDDFWVISKVK